MWPTDSITAQDELSLTGEHPRNNLEDDSLLPQAVYPYVQRQTRTYLQYLIPLIAIFVFPLIFAISVLANGRVPAPQRLASLAIAHPRVKGQIVAILATSLTATTRWALGGAAALLARKRLLQPRPVYEIDMFFSLRNISVIWDWRHRRRMMFLTWLLVALCGLLTSGFFTLLNPLAMEVHIDHPPIREINIAADPALYLSKMRSNNTPYISWPSGSSGTMDNWVSISDIPAFLQSMTRQYLASRDLLNDPIGPLVTTLRELYYTSFIGSTSGALISGEQQGWGYNGPGYPLGKPKSPSYSLDLQGTWVDVSCSVGTPSLNASGPYNSNIGSYVDYKFTCPGSSELKTGRTRVVGAHVLAFGCPMEGGAMAIYFRELTSTIFESVVNITCIISPKIGDVNATLIPGIPAFNVTRKNTPIPSLPPGARNFTSLIVEHVTRHFRYMPVFVYTIQAWYAFENLGRIQDDAVLELVEMTLSALFEFEASFMRLDATRGQDILSLPAEAVREVKVVSYQQTIGWEVKWTTWLGLLPLVAICIVTFAMISMAWWSEGKLTTFDPMSPVSLVAATSVGKAVFPNPTRETIGDPLDENVLRTRVSYMKRDETWGLWSSGGGEESIVKEPV